MKRFTPSSFTNLTEPKKLGVFTYLPQHIQNYEYLAADRQLKAMLEELPEELPSIIGKNLWDPEYAMNSVNVFCIQLELFSKHNPSCQQESWYKKLPQPILRMLARNQALSQVNKPSVIVPMRSSSELDAFTVERTALIKDIHDLFELNRLQDVRQLGHITEPIADSFHWEVVPSLYTHNRLVHVYQVAALANLIGSSLNVTPLQKKTLIIAALSHDARTPAGGDTTKLIDPDFFDEDKHYASLLESTDAQAFAKRHDVQLEEIVATVQGQGLLGMILDIADKNAYVQEDLHQFISPKRADLHNGNAHAVDRTAQAVIELVNAYPTLCNIWKHIGRDGEKIVFTRPRALSRFLLARILLFHALYYHSHARFMNFIVAQTLIQTLINAGTVKKEQLLEWTDLELDKVLEKTFGYCLMSSDFHKPGFIGCQTHAEAECEKKKLEAQGIRHFFLEKIPAQIKTGTDFLVQSKHGPLPLRDAYPQLAEPIDVLSFMVNPYRLYWIRPNEIPTAITRAQTYTRT